MKYLYLSFVVLFLISCKPQPPAASAPYPENSPQSVIDGLEKFDGYFPFYWDSKKGKIWLEIGNWNTEFLYQTSLPEGLGSNDIGLDRGKLGDTRVVQFVREGNQVLLIQSNYDYRANTDNLDEEFAVLEAFTKSVLYGFEVKEENDWSVIVDATPFFMRDVYGVADELRRQGQGSYSFDKSRSVINLERTRNFPQNSEFDFFITLTGQPKKWEVRDVSPDPKYLTVRQHHSFVELPDDNYKPRAFDPRSGYIYQTYMDYATPLAEPVRKRHLIRHRLEKKDPDAALSEPVEPIIYYLDPGVPEPVRSALRDGAMWWNEAFEAAGFKDAFRVEMLPPGADPMDVRYNLIQWVHRSTRGWSYGSSVTDPRTGEIIKGHVSLGSLRVRQDMLIAEGLLSPYGEDGRKEEVEKMALARLRQLSAHEVGHTIGLVHNYIASTQDRASVMDYPHPLILIDENGELDFSQAYDDKIGAWDKIAIKIGYSQFEENEEEQVNQIISEYIEEGYRFITDADARPLGGSHAYAHLWDNGKDPATELDRVMEVRKIALKNFGEYSIQTGRPFSSLEEVLVPIYYFHRYQVEAACKMLGGADYNYAARGDGQKIFQVLEPKEQRRALESVINTLSPGNLILPASLLNQIPPRAHGYWRDRELNVLKTGNTFDLIGVAESHVHQTLKILMHPDRMSRLVAYHAQDKKNPSLDEMLDRLSEVTFKSARKTGMEGALQRMVEGVYLQHLFMLSSSKNSTREVRALAYQQISELEAWITSSLKKKGSQGQKAHLNWSLQQIEQYRKNPDEFERTETYRLPDGSPIGSHDQEIFCGY